MKITALLVLKCNPDGSTDPIILANSTDVTHFGYFQRSSVKEFILFVGRTVAKRTPPSQRQSVQHEGLRLGLCVVQSDGSTTRGDLAVRTPAFQSGGHGFESNGEKINPFVATECLVTCHQYKVHSYNRNGLCALGFMDDHYPVRSAFSLLNQVLDEYQKNFGDSWKAVQADSSQPWPYLDEALTRFQDPAQADKLLKIQRELDETKIILHKTIDSVLERGEKLDSLVEKSSDLSTASQYTLTKSQFQQMLFNTNVIFMDFQVDGYVLQTGKENEPMLYDIVNGRMGCKVNWQWKKSNESINNDMCLSDNEEKRANRRMKMNHDRPSKTPSSKGNDVVKCRIALIDNELDGMQLPDTDTVRWRIQTAMPFVSPLKLSISCQPPNVSVSALGFLQPNISIPGPHPASLRNNQVSSSRNISNGPSKATKPLSSQRDSDSGIMPVFHKHNRNSRM
ncbi:VAMP-like protein YKT61 [Tanacetum coccineum]